MEFTAKQKFSALNDKHENLRDCEGLRIHPVASLTYQYIDSKDKEHTVLVIYNDLDQHFYRTEVMAFINKYMKYEDSFGGLPDEEKPNIVITPRTSKAGNKYVNFDLADDKAE